MRWLDLVFLVAALNLIVYRLLTIRPATHTQVLSVRGAIGA